MVIAIDEHGGRSGIVTLKDLFEAPFHHVIPGDLRSDDAVSPCYEGCDESRVPAISRRGKTLGWFARMHRGMASPML
jgi:hypothetical protein